jgi:hypothetical protein
METWERRENQRRKRAIRENLAWNFEILHLCGIGIK